MTSRLTVHSAVAVVPLADVDAGSGQPGAVPVSTRAGRLALRRALVAVARLVDPSSDLPADGFLIEHGPTGAPKVLALPPGFPGDLAALHVSVSHTRSRAWAVAAVEAARKP